MSSDSDSVLGTPLLAAGILMMVVSGLIATAGVFMKTLAVANWELIMQIGFLGGTLGCLLAAIWSVRTLWRYSAG